MRHSLALVAAVAGALLLLGPDVTRAAGPQPDPPAFGMFGVTGRQRAHLHVALPVDPSGKDRFQGGCNGVAGFADEAGKLVAGTAFTLTPGHADTFVFTPARLPDGPPSAAAATGPVRQQLRGVVVPADGQKDACATLIATVQVDNGNGVPTLTVSPVVSPRDPASGLPTGKRGHKPFVVTFSGVLAIGFGHTARLNIVNVGTGDAIRCTLDWTFVDETGVRTGGAARIGGGQAVHADFSHTEANRGPALLRGEVTVTEPDSGSCPADTTIVTLEGFDSADGQSHSIVPAQLIVPSRP